ncbi:unnamed protein product [Porites lobata]|uniref:Uncharacterized protein n=1 Tax=Porites lobata TaxID=104759 RepID=A0ABN8R8P5_9CNID|nr:unnamed protein product [Porites lobata]
MPWYVISTVHMITSLRASIPQVKQVWLADDSADGGSIQSLYQWYKSLCEEGRKFGYIVNGAKSWLIVKTSELAESGKKVFGDEVNITLEGRRHLGAVIGSKEFKDQYCQEKVDKWLREMESLTEISKSQSHAAYIAFTKGFKSKFTYYLRTIESFEEYVDPIYEVIHTSFLPSLFGRAEPLPEELKGLVSLSPAQGGIGIPDLKRESLEQFNASLDVTTPHVNSIVTQRSTIPARQLMEERKREINAKRRAAIKSRIDKIDESLSPDLLQAVQQTRDKGASSWLNAIPIEEHGLALNRRSLATPFAFSTTSLCLISLVTVLVEKCLLSTMRCHARRESTVTSREARLDAKAGGFWTPGVTEFFDVRVTHVNSRSNQGKYTATIFKEQENEKKRKYNQRVMDEEMGTFTSLVFGTQREWNSTVRTF